MKAGFITVNKALVAALLLALVFPYIVVAKDKKGQRGMLESMQSVPCGAKERGLTGLGSVMGSVGVEHVNSHEQLCPQYLLRTDDMDYHIRPMDLKHAAVLPVGREAEFKIKKDRLFLRVADGDKKELPYQVVSMEPANSVNKIDSTAYHPVDRPAAERPASERPAEPRPADNPPNGQSESVSGGTGSVPPPQL
jgi:hypothetical protein